MKKLTQDEAREIRARYASGEASLRGLAKEYGVSHMAVHSVVNGSSFSAEKRKAKESQADDSDIDWLEALYEVPKTLRLKDVM